MANIKITELSAASSLAATDVVPVVDVSEDVTKKITATNLFRTLPDGTAAAPALSFASDAGNGVFLAGTDTVGISTGGTQRVTVDGSGNVTISGGLTVEGQTTTVESTIVTIDDKNIELGSVATPTNTTADGGGITLKGATDKTIKWINSTGYWTFNTGIEVGGHIQLDDSNEIKIGNSQDLRIYHDGVNSQIREVGTGDLRLRSSKIQLMNPNSEPYFVGTSDGSAEVYYDNSKKLETKSDGIDVTGEVQCDSLDVDGPGDLSGNLTVGGELNFMGSEGHKYIDCNLGSAALNIRGTSGGDINHAFLAKFIRNGPVELYYSNTQKFATKSDGIDVTGEVQCDSLDVDGTVDITGDVNLHANLDMQDNDRLNIGSSNDFTIRHNGTDTHIENDTGTLFISQHQDDQDIAIRTDDGSGAVTNYILCDGSEGNVRLYHYGTQKLGTKSDGIDVAGEVQCDSLDVDGALDIDGGQIYYDAANNNLHFIDNVKARFGTGSDLRIYHDGSTSYIDDAGTGGLDIRSNEVKLSKYTGETLATFTADGSVSLRYNNAIKFETKGDGIDVTGEVQCDSLDVDGGFNINGSQITYDAANTNMKFADNIQLRFGAGNDLRIYHDGGNSYIQDTGTGNLSLQSNGSEIQLAKGGTFEHMVRAIVDGAVELYHNGSKKFETKSDGILVIGELESNTLDVNGVANIGASDTSDAQLEIGAGATGNRNSYVDLIGDTTYTDYGLRVQRDNGGANGASKILHRGTGDFRFVAQEAAAMEFFTSNVERLRIDSSGRLLLGTTTEGHVDADDLTVSSSGHAGITIRSGTTSHGAVYFSDGTSGNAEYRGYIDYDQDEDYIRLGSAAVERFRITSTGAWAIEGGSNYGTSGQVLTSNGNDAPTWQDLASVSVGGSSAISMNDNVKINFGNSNDLQIYHNGTNSVIADAGNGNLSLQTNDSEINFWNSTDSAYLLKATGSGSVELYHAGTKKFETKSDGIDVVGEVQCDSLDVDGSADITGQATIHSHLNIGGELGLMGTSDGNKYIDSRLGSGSLIFRGTSGGDANHTNLAVFTRTGAITLYHNNSPKFATKADGIDVTGEVQCDSLDVDGGANISGTTVFQGDVGIGNVSPGNSFDNGKSLALGDNDTGIRQNGDGVLELWSNNAQCFRVRNTGNISYVHLLPGSNNSYDLGTSGNRWRNVYTNDLNLSNEGSGNDVDGTWGNYTIQEGEDDLFLINRRNGKKYKFNLTEVS